MGAGGAGLSTPGPVAAVSDARASAPEAGPQDAAASGARFADALDSASGGQSGPARLDTVASAPIARPAAPARSGAQTNAAAEAASPDSAPAGAAIHRSAVATVSTAQSDADTDAGALAALLPALVPGPLPKSAASTSGADASAAPAAPDAVTKSDQAGSTVTDPAGLLAMILGVAPAISGASAGTGSGAGATVLSVADASAGSGASAASAAPAAATGSGARAANAGALAGKGDPGTSLNLATPQTADSGTPSTAPVVPLAALPAVAASRADGGDNPANQGTTAPSVQALSDLMRGLAPSAAQPSSVEPNISMPVGSTGWPAAVAAQVHWLAGSGVSSATLRLSPEHLGPVQVYIDLQSSQVNVSFSAAHADTRAALEQALPKLREMFAMGGLALGQASVQQEARSDSQSPASARVTRVSETTGALAPLPAGQVLGLVDEYA